MTVALSGSNAIGSWLSRRLDPKPRIGRRGDSLPNADVVAEAGGHDALAKYGVAALKQGSDLVIVSIGSLARAALERTTGYGEAQQNYSAGWSGCRHRRSSGCMACRAGRSVLSARKPPGSLSDALPTDRPAKSAMGGFFRSLLAGIGFDAKHVRIVADPTISENIHGLEARRTFGSFKMSIAGHPLPSYPKTSSLFGDEYSSVHKKQNICKRHLTVDATATHYFFRPVPSRKYPRIRLSIWLIRTFLSSSVESFLSRR
jgi:aspartate dehydrogenase